jgi:hypothetical protein
MQKILIVLGIVCILASIVGGGLKAMAIELPKLESKRSRWMLAGFGICLLMGSVFVPASGSGGHGSASTGTHR